MKKTIVELNKKHLKTDLPDLKPGQTVAVYQKIIEGEKERIQKFEGIILGRSGRNGINGTITVRKIAEGVGVEKIFPINLPTITKIEVLKTARVRRAKLYYLRSYKKKLKEVKVKK